MSKFLTKLSTLAFITLSSMLVVQADVLPSEPGPGAVYKAGGTCVVTWDADTESTTDWKDMAIQLMTGSNFEMHHLTTVAEDQDGTANGRFTYTCPEVDPYSAIYFYQFTSPHTSTKTWTTRFTITSPDGETVPPPNANQPGNNDPIPWGIGALADPSSAVPPPAFQGAGSSSTGTGSSTRSSSTSRVATSTSSTSKIVTSTTSSPTGAATNATVNTVNKDSGALDSVVLDRTVFHAVFAAVTLTITLPLWL